MSETVLSREQGKVLLEIARSALGRSFGLGREPDYDATWLHEKAATFVTLELSGSLRGCVGTIRAYRPLIEDVRGNARAAAFEDSRFPPLTRAELSDLTIEVSLLSRLERLAPSSEKELLGMLRPGVDGLVLEHGRKRGTFLPQVWESLPEPERFLAELRIKTGLRADFWAAELAIWRYSVASWSEAQDH